MKPARIVFGFVLFALFFTACYSTQPAGVEVTRPLTSSPSATATNATIQPTIQTITPSPTATVTSTETPHPTQTSMGTITPSVQPTTTWINFPAGNLYAPILLYHHVGDRSPKSRFFIDLETFRLQMETLQRQGYQSITMSTLVNTIRTGGVLPPHPVVITFDDGQLDIYQNAYPIMKEMGFVGTFYIVAGTLDQGAPISPDQLKEMIADGWEIGCHSMTHPDLRKPGVDLTREIKKSRLWIEKKLGVTVQSFAYPYGLFNPTVVKSVKDAGYTSAVGLGSSNRHGFFDLYYLTRYEVENGFDLKAFEQLIALHGAQTPNQVK